MRRFVFCVCFFVGGPSEAPKLHAESKQDVRTNATKAMFCFLGSRVCWDRLVRCVCVLRWTPINPRTIVLVWVAFSCVFSFERLFVCVVSCLFACFVRLVVYVLLVFV